MLGFNKRGDMFRWSNVGSGLAISIAELLSGLIGLVSLGTIRTSLVLEVARFLAKRRI